MIISGAMRAQTINSSRRRVVLVLDSSGPGMLGWTEIQEQAKMVAKELHRISQSERWSGHIQDDGGVASIVRSEKDKSIARLGSKC